MNLHLATCRIPFCLRMLAALALPLLMLLASDSLQAAENEVLEDLSARVQFDYYAGDARSLQRDLQALKQLEVDPQQVILRQYYLAYGHFRLAEMGGEKDRSPARKAASTCIDLAGEIVAQEPKRVTPRERARLDTLYAELWAIRGACGSLETELSLLPETSMGSNKARKSAAALAPNNPRVRLLAAIYASKRANTSQEFASANKLLLAVTQLFANSPPADSDLPDWGQADAWAWLGQGYLKLGDSVAARNALEQALVLAPDYVWARTLLSQMKITR
jgi:tetratricopeptide (TPR) repeat protein